MTTNPRQVCVQLTRLTTQNLGKKWTKDFSANGNRRTGHEQDSIGGVTVSEVNCYPEALEVNEEITTITFV